MADRVEILEPNADRPRVVTVDGPMVGIGSDAAAGIRIDGLAAAELRLVRTDRGYRAEPARPGASLRVNGQELFAKELAAGDVVELGPVRLRWLPSPRPPAAAPSPRPAARPRAPAAPPAPAQRPHRHRRRQGMPPAALVAIVLSIAVGALLLLRTCAGSTWPKTPQHYVDLARSQYGNGLFQQALGTLEFALNEATGETREQALQLQQQIRTALARATELPLLQAARNDLELLQSFVDRYLQPDPGARPAARELLRECREWQSAHGGLAADNPEAAAMAAQVAELQQRYAAAARPGEPDTAADVLFAAQAQLRFVNREYRVALQLLDGYLAANPGDAEVQAAREQLLADGAEWLQRRLANIQQAVVLGRVDQARRDLRQLRRAALLPQWQPQFEAVERQLPGR